MRDPSINTLSCNRGYADYVGGKPAPLLDMPRCPFCKKFMEKQDLPSNDEMEQPHFDDRFRPVCSFCGEEYYVAVIRMSNHFDKKYASVKI